MQQRLKPFTSRKRPVITADDVRANLRANRELVESGIDCAVVERRAYLVIAEALRRADLCFDTSCSRVYKMPDGIVLAVGPRDSSSWTHSFVLDDECAAHLALPGA